MNISVVIFGHNEADNLPQVIRGADEVLQRIAAEYEIIFVNDGSGDHTDKVINELAKQNPHLRQVTHFTREGIGTCLKDGFSLSQHDYVTFLPADGQICALDIEKLALAMEEAEIVTSIYTQRPEPFFRKFLSVSVRCLLFLLFGRHPRIEGTYMFRKKVLKNLNLISSSFVFNFEFVIKAYRAGFKFKEIETVCLPRLSGHSKILSFSKIMFVFCEIIKLRFKMFGQRIDQ